MAFLNFHGIGTEKLEPDSERVGDIFSRLGYAFEDAIADLVDNALDAEATRVHIRFVFSSGNVHSVIITNNGKGMNDEELKEAMRFGSRTSKSQLDLGKYGIGLKSASLSQADTVIVLSKSDGVYYGRRWTLENVKKDWTCELLDEQEFTKVFGCYFGEHKLEQSGTIVIWQRLAHLQVFPNTLERVIKKTIDNLKKELGIRFHRFLESKRLEISIDKHEVDENPTKVQVYILPLNPFAYNMSGAFGYPLTYNVNLDGINVNVECHIWPSNSKSDGYKLGGGKVSSRQGFYFYRNDRIIQAGGWNGMIADDSEPHLSLARVKIDLPPELDSLFKLDVTKSHIYPSPSFLNLLNNSSSNGVKFDQYLAQARECYRKKVEVKPTFPYIPGDGFPSSTLKNIALLLKDNSSNAIKKISFRWTNLSDFEVFRLDTKGQIIHLNSKYKRKLVEGGSDDAPIVKLLLLFLCQDKLGMTITSEKAAKWLQKINVSLLTAMRE